MPFRRLAPALIFLVLASPAHALDVFGEWAAMDGKSKVRFTPCGPAVCGAISWLKENTGKTKIGDRVFFDMLPDGPGAWKGRAFNPEDGREYSGKMTLEGGQLTTAGCVLGGLICKSYSWTRAD